MRTSARIHEAYLKMMKELLCLGELAFGRETNAYRHFKKSMMNETTELGAEIHQLLAAAGVSVPCDCGASLDGGPRWTRCPHCSGCGFRDAAEPSVLPAGEGAAEA